MKHGFGWELKDELGETVDQAAFVKVMTTRIRMAQALKGVEFFWSVPGNPLSVLDIKGTGKVDGKEMQMVMESLGSKMSAAEYEFMLSLSGNTVGEGPVDYKAVWAAVEKNSQA